MLVVARRLQLSSLEVQLSYFYRTGGTGYITGTVLDTLVNQRPQYEVTVLLRTVPAGFKERYPKVRVVEGNFDDFDLIAETASKSNISIREFYCHYE